ncbi:uncharacterized protein LOC127866724 isoform X5 [Dreissena polymorpha]|uniref:uncharacterized protein LOC127866724 isoform X5 n=1 Tax=Dreissena polymorpha TaxID=45954 RepID=UPI002264DCAA|nr:uncharacterized protein LOC127866724 isoform X5 [Dreissena polymorpha]
MAGTAYHMEALRKTRVIERKNEAMKKLKESIGQKGDASGGQFDTGDTPLVFSEPGHYAQNSSVERIRHRRCRALNEGEDKVLPLMNPPEYNFRVPLPPRKPHFKV